MEVEFELSGVVHRHKIDKAVFFVGRVSGNELRINDTTVSSKHAKITDNPSLAIIEDLGSTNGTRLNNETIRECAVKAGDCITFGRIPVRIISVGTLVGKGNVQSELMKAYKLGTSRSQSNQMFQLFKGLKITVPDGKGKQVPNPDSVIYAHAKSALGLA